jgi:tetratricopeptide (TPR) repeat protein
VGSPGDVTDERDRLGRVVEGLNRTLGKTEDLVLDLVRHATHAWPGFGDDAQDVINQQIDPYDVFVGVMWKRLGTPTHRADSGTVEEFERAYSLWQEHRRPALMFYFSRAPFAPTDLEELAQVERVLRFKQMLEAKGGLYWEYDRADEFETLVREHLYHEVQRLMLLSNSQQLSRSLTERGLGLAEIATAKRSVNDLEKPDEREEIRQLLSSLIERVERLDAANATPTETVPADALLETAHGLMASREWEAAARYFDRHADLDQTNWQALYSRAVAHANSRSGPGSDTAALRAYNDAIALRPSNIGANLTARLYSYRGAMLKRLGRLDEAEADLHVAETMATEQYERNDIRYNLAGVYAMKGRRSEALQQVRSLRGTDFIGYIKAHRDDYFASLAHDPEFLALL